MCTHIELAVIEVVARDGWLAPGPGMCAVLSAGGGLGE